MNERKPPFYPDPRFSNDSVNQDRARWLLKLRTSGTAGFLVLAGIAGCLLAAGHSKGCLVTFLSFLLGGIGFYISTAIYKVFCSGCQQKMSPQSLPEGKFFICRECERFVVIRQTPD